LIIIVIHHIALAREPSSFSGSNQPVFNRFVILIPLSYRVRVNFF
jgi:hypothetical protein